MSLSSAVLSSIISVMLAAFVDKKAALCWTIEACGSDLDDLLSLIFVPNSSTPCSPEVKSRSPITRAISSFRCRLIV